MSNFGFGGAKATTFSFVSAREIERGRSFTVLNTAGDISSDRTVALKGFLYTLEWWAYYTVLGR